MTFKTHPCVHSSYMYSVPLSCSNEMDERGDGLHTVPKSPSSNYRDSPPRAHRLAITPLLQVHDDLPTSVVVRKAGAIVRYFSRTTHWLFLVFCAYMLVYVHVSMYSADAMPSSVVPPQLLHICLNVMSLMQRLVANSWLEFTAGHCEAPQRHSRNLYIANVSYHGPDKTSSTRSCSQRVTEAHAVSPV